MRYLVVAFALAFGCGGGETADIETTHYLYKACSAWEDCACPDSDCGTDYCDSFLSRCTCTVIAANCDEGGCVELGEQCPAE